MKEDLIERSLLREEILSELSDLDDGTGTLDLTVDCALRDDPSTSAAEIRAMLRADLVQP